MILPNILKTIWWINAHLRIMDQNDAKINLVIIGQWPIFCSPLTIFALKMSGGSGYWLLQYWLPSYWEPATLVREVCLPSFPSLITCILETSSYAKMVKWFCLISLRLLDKCNTQIDLIEYMWVSYWPILYVWVIFSYIFQIIWWRNVILVWHNDWPKNYNDGQWPIFQSIDFV